MNKQEFLEGIRHGLLGLPNDDIEDRINFYCEMIEDRMEEGLSEEQAVSEMGTVDEVVKQIIADIPLTKLVKKKIKPKKKISGFGILLIVLGSPIWISLLIALLSVLVSLYVSVLSVIVSLWGVFVSFVVASFSSLVLGVVHSVCGDIYLGFALLGVGIALSGLSILCFFGCKAVTRAIIILSKKMIFATKNCIMKKGA